MNSVAYAFAVSFAATPLLVFAQSAQPLLIENAAANGYWTAERFKAAKPVPLPRASMESLQHQFEAVNSAQPAGRSAVGPTVQSNGIAEQLFIPSPPANTINSTVTPAARGSSGANYTSTRVFPIYTGTFAPQSADRQFPHRAAGKLFFSNNGSPFICSAAVIDDRIVATAGHCVHSGTASGFFSNFVFVPAFRDGAAPFGSWTARAVRVTSTWATGGGTVPNAADYAMMEMNDQTIGGVVRKIGAVTGILGWQTLSLASNHTSKLGYPANLDNAQKMQSVMSDNFQNVAPNTVAYGSDATGGSSGGPWVQNLEVASVGQTGSNLGSNRVVGITSYVFVDPNVKLAGSSILDSRWTSMLTSICALRAGNC